MLAGADSRRLGAKSRTAAVPGHERMATARARLLVCHLAMGKTSPARSRHGHCGRCKHDVSIVYRYPRARHAAKAYLAVPLLLLPALPIMMADYVFSLPMLMIYCMGVGPVLGIVTDRPTCSDCGAFIPGRVFGARS